MGSSSSPIPGTKALTLFRYSAIAHGSAGEQWLAKAENAASKVLTDAAYVAEDFEEVIVAAEDYVIIGRGSRDALIDPTVVLPLLTCHLCHSGVELA